MGELARFLAVLIYDNGRGLCSEHPHVYEVTHPEIAYRMALREGNLERFNLRFFGLSHLELTTEEISPIASSFKGSAVERVREKEDLEAFSDPKWINFSCDEDEIAAAMAEPPVLFEIEGLAAIAWHELSHAYGPAYDVPIDLRRLTSSDADIRNGACWQLGGSIYHQGTLYPATAAALPFLIKIGTHPNFPSRADLFGLLKAIAESAVIDPQRIRDACEWRAKRVSSQGLCNAEELIAWEMAQRAAVRDVFMRMRQTLQPFCNDEDKKVADRCKTILKHLQG